MPLDIPTALNTLSVRRAALGQLPDQQLAAIVAQLPDVLAETVRATVALT